MSQEKIIGILGGMGPEATVELMRRIVAATPAEGDNDHIRCVVDQNGKIPNRVLAIQGKIPSAGPVLADMARRLEQYGVDMLCMPCNTAHYFLKDIQAASSLPFVDMLEATAKHIHVKFPLVSHAAVLCTVGTRMTGLYEQRLANEGITAVYPDSMQQEELTAIIASVKAGNSGKDIRVRFQRIIDTLRAQGAPVMIAACTELSVICPQDEAVVDALDCLVAELVHRVKG